MTSSFDDAMRLLNKWSTESSLINVLVISGPVKLSCAGRVTGIDKSFVSIANKSEQFVADLECGEFVIADGDAIKDISHPVMGNMHMKRMMIVSFKQCEVLFAEVSE